jgi:rod shape determining protein RodA
VSQIQARQRLYRRSRQSLLHGWDPVLTAVVALLLIIGTLLVWAATRDWYIRNGLDGQYYLKRHVINILIGGLLAYGATVVDYRLLRAYTPFLWGAGVIGLTIVLIPGLGSEVNGARAWINLPGGFQIQPAELAKIAIIIGMSMILSERTHDSNEPTSKDVLQALGIAAIPVILIILQPDMGTILIIAQLL